MTKNVQENSQAEAAMLDLHEQLTNMDDGIILAEVALRVPPAVSWLPQAVQRIEAAKVTLGTAIMEAASQTEAPTRFDDCDLVQLANLNEAVRAMSSSPRALSYLLQALIEQALQGALPE